MRRWAFGEQNYQGLQHNKNYNKLRIDPQYQRILELVRQLGNSTGTLLARLNASRVDQD
ncbi:MAG: hypothetical protein WCE50_03700 [Candidatus Acidiferrum sp.]